jgi:Uncharacterized protein conserved in bacteria (DUF2272)/D-alanyl-D-alanine carboxypeptidase
MNNRFELELFETQPFFFEEEVEDERGQSRKGARVPARKGSAKRQATARRRPAARPRPRPQFPIRFPVIPLPYPAWPGVSPDPANVPDSQEPRLDSAQDDMPPSPPENDPGSGGSEQQGEASFCPTFTPLAVEDPGGGRVKNKTAPHPQDLVNVERAFGGKVPLHRLAAAALNAMQCAARANGINPPLLQLTSGFRDPKRQAELWAEALKKYGSPEAARKWVAPPGGSAHQSGRAVDFYLGGQNSSSNVGNLQKLPAYRWLLVNARRFGFYPYEREPWHWEYNPPKAGHSELYGELYELSGEFEDEGIGPATTDQEWSWGSLGNLFGGWGSTSTQPAPSPAGGTAAPVTPSRSSSSALAIRNNAVTIATREWDRWGRGSIKESDPKMRAVLEDYWFTGTGSKRTEPSWWSAVPWSAAFISWVMKKAGAGSDFKYSASHSEYTVAAKANRMVGNNNLFKAYRITERAPRVGDLICQSRAGSGATYDNIKVGMSTHCDIVTAVEPNRLTAIGGNLSDSVSRDYVQTDANGYITESGYFAVIRIGD